MTRSKTPQEILLGAAEIIQRDGWHQGDLYQRPEATGDMTSGWDSRALDRDEKAARTAPVCAVGAVIRSARGTARWLVDATTKGSELKPGQDALNLLERHLGTPDHGMGVIPEWNDAPERTAEDVILALKHAAHIDGAGRAADNE